MKLPIVVPLACCAVALGALAPADAHARLAIARRADPAVAPTVAGVMLDSAPIAMPPQPAATAARAAAPAPATRGIIIEPLPPPAVAVTLRNLNSDEVETFAIVPDGRVDITTAAALTHFFRCR